MSNIYYIGMSYILQGQGGRNQKNMEKSKRGGGAVTNKRFDKAANVGLWEIKCTDKHGIFIKLSTKGGRGRSLLGTP